MDGLAKGRPPAHLSAAASGLRRGFVPTLSCSHPIRYGQYQYYSRTLEGQQYSVHCRRRLGPGAGARPSETDALDPSQPEEVLLDENAEARAHAFYMVGGFEVSPNHKYVAGVYFGRWWVLGACVRVVA